MLIERVGDVHEMVVWILGQRQVVKLCMVKSQSRDISKLNTVRYRSRHLAGFFKFFPQKVEIQWLKFLNADACRRFSTSCTRQSRCSVFASSTFPLAWLTDFQMLYICEKKKITKDHYSCPLWYPGFQCSGSGSVGSEIFLASWIRPVIICTNQDLDLFINKLNLYYTVLWLLNNLLSLKAVNLTTVCGTKQIKFGILKATE